MSKADDFAADAGDGLNHLYRRYSAWLGRRLRSRVDADTAADVVQETYLRIAHHAVGEIRHPKAFLLEVALNLVRDRARAAARREKAMRGYKTADGETAPQLDQVLLLQILRDMPQLYRDVFVLSRFEGMTYPEIARSHGISVDTVQWRMARALEYCASRLDL